jgi:hypothetical protein
MARVGWREERVVVARRSRGERLEWHAQLADRLSLPVLTAARLLEPMDGEGEQLRGEGVRLRHVLEGDAVGPEGLLAGERIAQRPRPHRPPPAPLQRQRQRARRPFAPEELAQRGEFSLARAQR